jgi:hypothetical protein
VTPACPTCAAATDLVVGAAQEATVGTVAALVEARPLLRCRGGHDHPLSALDRSARAAIEADVVAALERSLPRARARRWRPTAACAACGVQLTMPVRRTTWPVTVARPGTTMLVLTVHLDVPATRCPGCGVDQVPPRSQGDLTGAVLAALGLDAR